MNYNPLPFERLLRRLIARQLKAIEKLIDNTIGQVAWQAGRLNGPKNGDFYFRNHPVISRAVDEALKTLSRKIVEQITVGSADAWELANLNNDSLISYLVKSIGPGRIPPGALLRWQYATRNLEALKTFQKRKSEGLGLSDKVWLYVGSLKQELELAIDIGLGDGKSADSLSRAVRRYLRNPEALFRRVRNKETGVLRLSKAAAAYHPGQGVYRSAYKNAKRLATTETNMAYRTADFERRQGLDFILGIRVNLSKNHTCLDSKGIPRPFFDICDILQGDYPKWFKFVGWHPNCRCYTTTILPSKAEFFKYLDAMDENGNSTYIPKGEITELPPQFKQWVAENAGRIEAAQKRGTLPYFLRDNVGRWEEWLTTRKELPGTLIDLDKSIAIFEASGSYGGDAKRYSAEVEEAAKHLLDANDFGMHISSDFLENVRKEGFKNQFQTGNTRGAYFNPGDIAVEKGGIPEWNGRLRFSHEAFLGGRPTDSANQLARGEYEKYGCLMSPDMKESLRSSAVWMYGDVQVRFKKDRVLCTFTANDSLGRCYQPTLTSAPRACSFDRMKESYLPIHGNVEDDTNLADVVQTMGSWYVELQYHGELTAGCVESLLISKDITQDNFTQILREAREWKKLGVKVFYRVGDDVKELL